MKIGAKMRQIRQHRHLTQRELGEKIGLGRNGANRIAQYEMGDRTPKRDQLNKIARALNVPEETLSLEADETLQALLHNLLWLDRDDAPLIELHLLNKENCLRPCNRIGKAP
jgi:transcriptional regulator with XRE-family HTH domain